MKTSDETIAWIFKSIQNAYNRPAMYACTKRGLGSVLSAYHSTWAFITGRQDELRKVLIDSLGGANTDSHIIGDSDHASDYADFAPVIQQWQWIDNRLGISLAISPKD